MGLVNSENTIAALEQTIDDFKFIIHIGDISYADSYMERHDTYETAWVKWQDVVQPITQAKPYMVLPGNHDVTCNEDTPDICPPGQRNMTAYKHRFRMPGAESGGVGNLWYSYDYGLVHFIHINMETDFPNAPSGINSSLAAGGEVGQMEWLEADLQHAVENRKTVPFIIALAHRPLYTAGGGCDVCVTAFESLFVKYDLDIFFAGHQHWYERLYPLLPGGVIESYDYVDPKAPIYIVNGAAGNIEGHPDGKPLPYTAILDNSDYGYGVLSIVNRTTLNWEFRRATDKSLVDQVQIVKHH